jgi:hypothetical protein
MKRFFAITLALAGFVAAPRAWDYEGHRIVNQLALASLPTNFPSFVRSAAAAERIAFLAGEPDRWRNSLSATAKHASGPDHFLDIDELSLFGLAPATVSPFRYDFTAQLKIERDKHPEKFPAIDPAKNADHSRDLVGFLPWALNEHFAKLQSAFSYLKTFEQYGGTPDEIANARENVIYLMGVMGHYAGDAAQPLHTTKHFNGWIGENPKHYTTNKTIHSWIDGGFIRKAEIKTDELKPKVRGARWIWSDGKAAEDVFAPVLQFIVDQSTLVERVYQLDRSGELSPGKHDITAGRAFIGGQLVKGGQFLGDMWFSAWQSAPADTFLRSELNRRTAK